MSDTRSTPNSRKSSKKMSKSSQKKKLNEIFMIHDSDFDSEV